MLENNENNGTMESVSADAPKERRSVIKDSDLSPIEVESTLHIEKEKHVQVKAEAIKETKKELGSYANEIFDWLETILMGVVTIVVIFTFFIRVNTVSGPSMNPTLLNGEKLLVTDLFYTPAYNDIVVIQAANLRDENGHAGKPIVKRIVGMPNDTIRIDFESGTVYRNGEALETKIIDGYLYEDGHYIADLTYEKESLVSNKEYVVPEDCYFVLGDNRNNSTDSRSNLIGFVEREYIAGKVFFRILPFNSFGAVN